MKILVYGFGPYGKYPDNVTERIIQKLKSRQTVITKIFPVRFDQEQFLKALQNPEPDAILGLGQYTRGSKIRIEHQASNIQRNNNNTPQKPIKPGKAEFLPVSLRLQPSEQAILSSAAGSHVCNFSMYTILDALQNKNIPYAFLHIPRSINITDAVNFVETVINRIEEQLPPTAPGL